MCSYGYIYTYIYIYIHLSATAFRASGVFRVVVRVVASPLVSSHTRLAFRLPSPGATPRRSPRSLAWPCLTACKRSVVFPPQQNKTSLRCTPSQDPSHLSRIISRQCFGFRSCFVSSYGLSGIARGVYPRQLGVERACRFLQGGFHTPDNWPPHTHRTLGAAASACQGKPMQSFSIFWEPFPMELVSTLRPTRLRSWMVELRSAAIGQYILQYFLA